MVNDTSFMSWESPTVFVLVTKNELFRKDYAFVSFMHVCMPRCPILCAFCLCSKFVRYTFGDVVPGSGTDLNTELTPQCGDLNILKKLLQHEHNESIMRLGKYVYILSRA